MLIDDIKIALRVTSESTDLEIEGLIAAAIADIMRVGVKIPDRENIKEPLVKQAIVLFCKAHYGYDNGDFQKFHDCYNAILPVLSVEWSVNGGTPTPPIPPDPGGDFLKYATTITGNGSSESFAVTHNLNTDDVSVTVKDVETSSVVMADIEYISANEVKLTFAPILTSAQNMRIIVLG
jgi:hypothetical protein